MEDAIKIMLFAMIFPAIFIGVFSFVRRIRQNDIRQGLWPWMRGRDLPLIQPMQDGRTTIELEKLRLADRDKARAMYERLAMEKLEVLKQSIQMGYKEEDLGKLDARLERIIGSAELTRLLSDAAAPVPGGASVAAQAASVPGPAEIQSSELSAASAGPQAIDSKLSN